MQLNTTGKYHWTSLVAPLSVSLDVYLDVMATSKASATTTGAKAPVRYTEEVFADPALARYTDAMLAKEMTDSARVFGEEIMRIRSGGGVRLRGGGKKR